MYHFSKALFYKCFSCQVVRCFGSNLSHRSNLHTLGKPSVIIYIQIQYARGMSNSKAHQAHTNFKHSPSGAYALSGACGSIAVPAISEHIVGKHRNAAKYYHAPGHNTNSKYGHVKNAPFVPQKMLVLPKVTRLAFEKRRNPDLSETELRDKLARRGSDYENLVERHSVHMRDLGVLVEKLKQTDAEVRVCQEMSEYTEENIAWADLVISAGGDGTFLTASRKVFGNKPIIGVNTDIDGSEGFLCLPAAYSSNITRTLDLMKAGSYRWRKRARIRVSVKGGDTSHPIDLYEDDLTFTDHRNLHDHERQRSLEREQNGEEAHILPIRALNEVFVGESLSSRMSYYEISIDDGPLEKQKSSGITICTGTGSTSWSFNINKLSYQSVEEVLKIANRLTGSNYPTNPESVKTVADSFNGRLLFDSRVLQMVYTVRDPVVHGIFQVHRPRGFARKITIRSRCQDACLTVDAGISYLFNDGAIATLEMHDEDALRTMEMVE